MFVLALQKDSLDEQQDLGSGVQLFFRSQNIIGCPFTAGQQQWTVVVDSKRFFLKRVR